MRWARFLLASIGAPLAILVGFPVLFGWLFVEMWAPAATPENASPPSEPFYFVAGAVVGFAVAVLTIFAGSWWLAKHDLLPTPPRRIFRRAS